VDYPGDLVSWEVEDQFLFGGDILVAPVYTEGARERRVYLPAGSAWLDAWTGAGHAGGQWVTAPAPLELVPVYLRPAAASSRSVPSPISRPPRLGPPRLGPPRVEPPRVEPPRVEPPRLGPPAKLGGVTPGGRYRGPGPPGPGPVHGVREGDRDLRSRTTEYGANYPKVSQAIRTAIQSAITGTSSVNSALSQAQSTISGIQKVSG
jgi:Glycosyl hydrolases family 31